MSDKNDLQKRILKRHKNRKNNLKRVPLRESVNVEILGSIEMASKNSVYFFTRMAIVYVVEQDQHYWVDYNKELPPINKFLIQSGVKSIDWEKKIIDNETADVIINALDKWKEVKKPYLNSFTFLVSYCLANDVNLIKEKLIIV